MRLTRVRAAARYLAASGLIVASVLGCGYLVIVATFLVGSSTSDPNTTQGWMREVAFSSGLIAQGALWAVVGLTVTVVCALGGALMRRRRWMWVGVACSVLFAFTLLFVTISGPAQLDRLVERATAAVSQAAAVGPVTDTNDVAVNLAAVVPKSAACGDSGSEASVQLDFRTGDNAQSLDRILAAWDSAGYAPDHAMQEDLRYSATLPIAKMIIRDSTTIDGLIHMDLVGQCAAP